jgi:type IV secretory pathway VirD2 relaxase
MSSCVAEQMTDGTSSSVATTSAKGFGNARLTWSRLSSARELRGKSRRASGKEVEAERWTSLDRALRNIADGSAGFVDLRPSAEAEDQELRSLLLGRASKLEGLGLAESIGPGQWSFKRDVESTLRDLAARGDIIKTMHQAMTHAGREPDVSGFALHGEEPGFPWSDGLSNVVFKTS